MSDFIEKNEKYVAGLDKSRKNFSSRCVSCSCKKIAEVFQIFASAHT